MKTNKTKVQYRIRNWPEYNSALCQRGSLTFWIDEQALCKWFAEEEFNKRGHPFTYSATAIEFMSILKAVYHLPLRATKGLVESLMDLLDIDLPVPCYSTLSRRRNSLEVKLPHQSKKEPIHIVVDSTGIKVYGEGEWKVRQHGYTYRRTWRKLHIGLDESTHEIMAAVVTTNNYTDKEILPDLLEVTDALISQVSGDGGYDYATCYEAIEPYGARATIPPRSNAVPWHNGQVDERDRNLERIEEIGRKEWKQECGYHRRSLAETAMLRLKLIFGDKMHEKNFDTQAAELLIRCAALNKMTALGMPHSYPVQ